MSNQTIIAVTQDAEIYRVANITGHTDAQSIRNQIFSRLQVPDEVRPAFAIYRTELGGLAIGQALDDSQLLDICLQLGDEIGSLKFIIQRANSSPNVPAIAPIAFSLPNSPKPSNSSSALTTSLLYESQSEPVGTNSASEAVLSQSTAMPATRRLEMNNLPSTPSAPNVIHSDQVYDTSSNIPLNESDSPDLLLEAEAGSNITGVPARSLQQAGISWARGSPVGRSLYGRVYHALNIATGKMMAVKQVDLPQSDKDHENSEQNIVIEALWNECNILKRLKHRNIMQYLGFERTIDTLSMFLEYIPGRPISQLLRDYKKLEDEAIQFFSRQIVDGLRYLHTSGVTHCNLKCGNVLVDKSGTCKIIGFSVSERSENAYQEYQGTGMRGSIYWMAPEMIHDNNQSYNAKVDMWSLGCTILEMQIAQPPWLGVDIITVLHRVGTNREAPPVLENVRLTPRALDFRQNCFYADPAKRPTAAELLLHPWLENSSEWTFRGFDHISAGRLVSKPAADSATNFQAISHDLDLRNATRNSDTDIQPDNSRYEKLDLLAIDESGKTITNTSFSANTMTEIKSSMLPGEIIQHLVSHGCQDSTMELEFSSCSDYPISTGGFGDVYRGKLKSGIHVAIKCMRFIDSSVDGETLRKDLKHAAREIHTWSKLQHPNVLRLLGLVEYRGQIGMLSMWIERGAIRAYLAQNPMVNRPKLCTQIADGLSYLHDCGVVHGDLKGDNVLISDMGEPLLADFGNAVLQEQTLQFTHTTTKNNVSLRWAAPELLGEKSSHSVKADIFALGMTILEVVTSNVPYMGLSDVAVTFAVVQHQLPKRPETYIPARSKYGNFLWLLMKCCWDSNSELRPTAAQVRQNLGLIHPNDLISYQNDEKH